MLRAVTIAALPILLLAGPAFAQERGVTRRLQTVAAAECRRIPPLDPRRAASDARRAARRGNVYLLGLESGGETAPGAGPDPALPVRLIAGTGPVTCTTGKARARAYAVRFNRAMIASQR